MFAALRIAPFGRLLVTYTLDEAADWLVGIALAVYVYDRTQSALAVAALLLATRFGPSLVISPLAGRLGGQPIGGVLAGLYGVSAAAALILAAAAEAPVAVLYALSFLSATAAATGRVLTRTAACNLLDAHGRLRDGAAALNVSYGAINVLGPALAGAVTVLVGPRAAVLGAAVVFAGLAAAAWTIRIAAAEKASSDEPVPVGVRDALALLTSHPGIGVVLAAATSLLVLFSLDEPIMLPYTEQSLGGDTTVYATLLTLWGAGILLGGATFTALRRRSMLGTFVLAGGMLAVAYVTLGAAHSLALAGAASVIGGAGNGMFWGALTVITLEAVPPAVRARTSGAVESLALAAPGVGYLLGGGLSELLSPAQVYLLAGGLGGIVVAALGLALWHPARRVAPAMRPTIVPSPNPEQVT